MRELTHEVIDVLLFAVVIVLTIIVIKQCSRKAEEVQIIENVVQRDTNIIQVVDTCYFWNPRPIALLPIHDTLLKVIRQRDTIWMSTPVVSKVYEDSTYKCMVSGGYFARLDYLKIYDKRIITTINNNSTTYRRPRFVISLGVTAGYDPVYNRMSYMVGIHGGVPLWNFYEKK